MRSLAIVCWICPGRLFICFSGVRIEAQIKPHTTSCSDYLFGGPEEGRFSVRQRNSCRCESNSSSLVPCIARNLALQFTQLPSTVFVCKVRSFGSTKWSLWLTMSWGPGSWFVKISRQPFVKIRVSGRTCRAMMGSKVAAEWSGTTTIMHKFASRSAIPRTQWPSWKWPRWYLQCMNLLSTSTVQPSPPICTGWSSRYRQQILWMCSYHSIMDVRDIRVSTHASACYICHDHQ